MKRSQQKAMFAKMNNCQVPSHLTRFEVVDKQGKVVKTFSDRGKAWDYLDAHKDKKYKWHVAKPSITFYKDEQGHNRWKHSSKKGAIYGKPQFKVTGFYANSNKKFKTLHFDDERTARSINLWRGKVYKYQPNGKYKVIKEVYN